MMILSRVSQFICRRGEDCEHEQAHEADENDADHVNRLAVNSNGAEDEAQIVNIMNASVTLRSPPDEAAAVLIRQRSDSRTKRLECDEKESGKLIKLRRLVHSRSFPLTGVVTLD